MSTSPSATESPVGDVSPSPASPDDRGAPRRRMPRWTVINYWVDLTLLAIFVTVLFTTGVVYFVFPAGPRAFECRLWGWDFNRWRDVQFGTIAVFTGGVVLHLMLHWNWLCSVTNTHLFSRPPGRDDGSRTLLGVGLLMGILHGLGIGLLYASWSLQSP